ncbi:preprotein translocase subunit SecE [Calorimonas adulescens]|uniref:Protein translocase subunit SecE n=1 Tax=Calorimonas adulescens TaxID=2606906 RepID=A0A5D8QGQ2_9THEO|nr:preprotein translocase subunit SecE [Calorimonas adulescens]TZE82703.1 preprotein translocase subunit SecE [Calorimonas adulescens]
MANNGGGIKSISNFFHDVRAELRKVTWPDRSTVRTYTMGVILIIALLGLFIFLADSVFVTLLNWILSL